MVQKKMIRTPVELALKVWNEAWAAKDVYKLQAISHTQRVQSLYRRARRDLAAWSEADDWEDYLVQRTILRERFEKNRNIKDMRIAKKLVQDGEEELWINQHPQPLKFCWSPGGVCYGREAIPPDDAIDFWHPIEKAAYPYYFAKREQRKLEYMQLWEMGAATAGGPGVGRLSEAKFRSQEKGTSSH